MTQADLILELARVKRLEREAKNDAAPSGNAAGDGSLDPLDGRMKRRTDCMRALQCLYIAVDAEIAKDVNEKVRAYIRDLEAEHSPIDGDKLP